ncbi:MAG: HAMP domain-containing protein [Pirellulaceae bacterium]|nr:HAMP domain-containing protein [Pirellulaceae bacterium]
MKIPRLAELMIASRQAMKWMFGHWSLQRKSQLFLSLALMVPIGLAFWFLSQIVAKDLVRETTRQSARDHARSVVAWKHVESPKFGQQSAISSQSSLIPPRPVEPRGLSSSQTHYEPEAYAVLRRQLVDNPYFRESFLMLDTEVMHENLGSADLPATEVEQSLMERLQVRYRQRLSQPASTTQSAAATSVATETAVAGQTRASENVVTYFSPPGTVEMFDEDGPVFDDDAPDGGWYVYYHVVQFPDKCLMCHPRDLRYQTADIPFRVVKVKIPYSQTQVVSATTLAVMITIAMVTIACALLFVQYVFRNIVLNPLNHLRTVTDEISRGNVYLRATLDTGDEFSELGEAFNRMLRHMTEGQSKLRELNMELDMRVDQLAQVNLQLYEANRLKSDFLANMSHELRTPLNSILGFSEVLQGIEALSDKQRKYVSNIQGSGRVLLEMINDILDLAKMEAGKMKVSPAYFSLPDLIRAQCTALQSLVDEKNMDLQINLPDDMPLVFQDQSKIQQILTNLLSNAIKFTPDGGVITVQAGHIKDQHFAITVSDTGVGIPESDFEIIFEKFRQSSVVLQQDGLTRQYSGTGLGLSIVRELCRLLGGEVRLSSQLGTGSTFQIMLPMHFQPSVAPPPNEPSQSQPQ